MEAVVFWIYIVTIICSAGIAGFRYRIAGSSIRFICILFLVVPLAELSGIYSVIKIGNNVGVYNIFSFAEFLLLCLYFNFSVDIFRKYRLGYMLAVAGGVFGIANALLYQPLTSAEGSNFIAIQIVAVFGMCFLALYRLLIYHRESNFKNNPHYAIILLLLVNWLVVFIHWGMGPAVEKLFHTEAISLYTVIQLVNIAVSIGFSLVFLLLSKQFKYQI